MEKDARYKIGMDKLADLRRAAERARKAASAYENRAAERDAIIREIADDYTLAVLAAEAGVSVSRISHIVGNRGVKVGRPRRKDKP